MKRIIISLSFLCLTLFSCKKNEPYHFELGHDYLPMQEGVFVKYNVTEIHHDIGATPSHDTIRYILKTRIGEEYVDNIGRRAHKLYRYSFNQEDEILFDERVWTTIIDGNRGEVVEENQRMIRLNFPIKENKEWDLNAFNAESKKKIHYERFAEKRTINGIVLDNTVQIEYDDFLSLVDYNRCYEIYAKGIGLVERYFKNLTIDDFDTLSIRKGTEVHYRLIDYGIE